MQTMKFIKVIGMAVALGSASLAYAAQELAPVVDVTNNTQSIDQNVMPTPGTATMVADNQQGSAMQRPSAQTSQSGLKTKLTAPITTSVTQSMTLEQRVSRLEQQMTNLTRMNLPQQIADLQQTIQQVQGELQVQQHDLKLLNSQQRSFYQDLDQRISQLKTLVAGGDSSDNSSSSSSSASKSPSGSVSTTDIQMKDSNTYQAAFKFLTKKQYSKALSALQSYITDYPNGQFLANAHYWMGEIYLLQKNYKKAVSQFSTVVNNYPKSSKVADAKLKRAIANLKLGNTSQARTELQQIKKSYPGSTAAQLASIQLQQIGNAPAKTTTSNTSNN